jgi:Tfp pilus assembly protein PilO
LVGCVGWLAVGRWPLVGGWLVCGLVGCLVVLVGWWIAWLVSGLGQILCKLKRVQNTKLNKRYTQHII